MYIKEVTYTDFGGTKRTERFYFNLTKTEVIKLEYGSDISLAERIQKLMDSNDQPAVMRLFDTIIEQAYGIRSDDGREFLKSKEISNKFMHSAAYDAIFVEMATDARAVAEFINHVIPDMSEVIEAAQKNQAVNEEYIKKLEEQRKAAPGKAPVEVEKPVLEVVKGEVVE